MIDYFYDAYLILNKVYSEKAFIKQAIASTPIEEKYRSATIKTVYGVLDKDVELSYYIKKLSPKNPKLVVRTLLKISMYSIFYLKKAPYAVIDSAVELTKKLGKSGMSGFVNAVLRKFSTQKIDLPENEIERLSIKHSYPVFAVERLINDYGHEVAEKIMSHEDDSTYVAFFGDNGEDYLKELKANYSKTVFDKLFLLKNFTRNVGFDKGDYTFQNIGSYAICDIVASGEKLIDVCSAPGGKSINLSRKFSTVTALELHPHRVELVNQYASRMGVKNVVAMQHDSTQIIEDFIDKYDACLCDVPCSGFGVLTENPDIKLNREESSIEELNKIQLNILKTSSNYVKKGGYLYYSTCSVFKDENQKIVDNFLIENKNFVQEEIVSKLNGVYDGKGLQFLPHLSGGGFFIAKLKRIN